jgi:3-methyladenine DNA glycosylase AlkD
MNTDPDNVTELVAAIENEMAAPHKTPALRALRKKYSKLLHDQYGSVVIRIGLSLLRKRVPAARFMAYELIANHPKAPLLVGSKELFRLGTGLDSWDAVDMFAIYLVGPAWRDGRIKDELIEYWAKLANRWWRRAALVSTVPLNSKAHGGLGDTARTSMVCRMLLDDRDDMVVKALSWALRELSKRDPKAVAKFVDENRAKLAARVLREVGNKIRTGKKNPKLAK